MTQKRSFGSVKVSYLSADKVLRELRQAAIGLKQNPNVQKVFLFGSIVRGEHRPGSDVDISIILKEDHRRIIDRIPEFLDYFSEVSVPVDIFPYTLAEAERMQSANNPFVREIFRNGVEL